MNTLSALPIAAAGVALASMLAGSPAHAVVTGGETDAYALEVDITETPPLGPSVPITVTPLPVLLNSPPPPYNNESESVITIPGLLSGSLLDSSDASDVDGTSGAKFANAATSIQDFILSVPGLIITADVIGSTSKVSGDYGSLALAGSTTLTNVSVNGVTLPASPTANTVLIDALGLKVVLNEQFPFSDGIYSAGLTVNGIHIFFTDFMAGTNIVDGEILLGHSHALLTATPNAVPEPAALAILGTGLLGLGLIRRPRVRASSGGYR